MWIRFCFRLMCSMVVLVGRSKRRSIMNLEVLVMLYVKLSRSVLNYWAGL